MLSVVTRQFRSDRDHAIGEVVDTSGWRHERHLREQGYIRPASADEIAVEQTDEKTRRPADARDSAPARTATKKAPKKKQARARATARA